jgi:hypothetical protein
MRKHPKKENLQIILTNNSSIFLKIPLARNFSKRLRNYAPDWLHDRLANRELQKLVKANENKPIIEITPPKVVPTEPSLTPNIDQAEPKSNLAKGLDFKDEEDGGGGE